MNNSLVDKKKTQMDFIAPAKEGEIVEGTVIKATTNSLYLDLGAKGIGTISGKEFFENKNQLKNLQPGQKITVKIICVETEEGYRGLSLMNAMQDLAWKELAKEQEKQTVFDVTVHSANKGGLICFLNGIQGFLPTSQLLPEHFPRVEGADPAKIASELQKMVGSTIKVRIFDLNPGQNKLILSEKAVQKEEHEKKLISLRPGAIVEGKISGITHFGIFIIFEHGLEGLILSSEIPTDKQLQVGQTVKARITEITNNKVYLSLKI